MSNLPLPEVKAGDIDVDLPGPDFIVGLCVSKDDIEAQIRKGLRAYPSKLAKNYWQSLTNKLQGQAHWQPFPRGGFGMRKQA